MGFLATPKARSAHSLASASTPASRRPGGLPLRVLPHRTTGARGVRQAPRVWREESSPHLKPINKIPRLIRTATAVIVAGGLAVMVLSAQDDLDTVRQAAEQGDATAQFNLGNMYASGRGVLEDDAEAVRWYRLAAEQGLVDAQFMLGNIYGAGSGVPQDDPEAARWFRLAAEQGHAAAQFYLGVRYNTGMGVLKDAAEAVRWFHLAAEQGDATAQFNLGNMYANGEGVPQDAAEAVRWYRLAAEQGDAAAQFYLGVRYANGDGVPEDKAEAVQWYRQAAEQGLTEAQYNLGVMYDNGQGVPEDDAEAVKWYRRAAEQGEKAEAQLSLDWRQLEFPATTNGIPRFFRADPDHEGMVKDQQVRRLVKLKKNEKTLTMAAAKAGMSRKTARKYLKSGKLPSQCQPERYWRTRSDPFESVWPEVKEILKRSPTVEAKAVFDHLCRQQEGAFQQGQLRTLQRRIKQWKAEYGEAKEVMFPQKYQPGHQAQSDFTFMGRLGVTIQGQPFPHLLYHFVLAYSNWEATTLCFSESFESLSLGLQNALWELGALPEEHRTDRLSAAVKNLKREEFTERYQALLRHFGMRSSRTQAGKAHENGDVEQSHHRLKRAIEQELLLRCSRDFSSREEYEGFVAVIVSRRNAARQKRLGEELAVMRPLPARRLDDFTRQWVRVSPSSTIRVRHNTYSVDSRLIGERVQVRVWADQVEVYYGGRRQARMPRLRGEGKHRIDYRHVIHSLVRKPGAFTRYRWREDLFPGILFRVAYDELRRDCPATADRQYLKILEVAAQEGEQRVREALQVLIERGQRIRFEALRECLVDPVVEPWEVMVEKMDVGLYDTLLENREVRS